ncbi:MAG: hypothetical protein K9K67_04100 [Bacteriovoracaceae bacterium]|nr:hypothetical protein [Bacteriovoracaceae bacterium]
MSFFEEAYFCSECKKLSKKLDELLFVENDGQNGFCSETCIEKFFEPLVNHFEELEKKWRSQHSLLDEEILEAVGHPVFMDQLLRRPDEVYLFIADGGEHYYSFIVEINDDKYGDFSMMCLCLTYDNQPSFIISASASKEDGMIDNYRWGKKIEDVKQFHSSSDVKDKKKHIEIDEQTLMEVEGKKSAYLAGLIEDRSPADIPIESFSLYEQYFEPTMMEPDEIYSSKDEEGDTIFTYIKAHDREGVSFYYFIVCLRIEEGFQENTDALVPIVSFPSVDGELYRTYRRGELISGNLKN